MNTPDCAGQAPASAMSGSLRDTRLCTACPTIPLPEPDGVLVIGTQALRAFIADTMLAYGAACAAAEREACAVACENEHVGRSIRDCELPPEDVAYNAALEHAAAAIRARSSNA